jgi:hypothetical protein
MGTIPASVRADPSYSQTYGTRVHPFESFAVRNRDWAEASTTFSDR